MDQQRTDDPEDDAIKNLASLAMEFAGKVGLKPKHDDRLLDLMLAAYRTGAEAGTRSAFDFLGWKVTVVH